MTTKQKSALKTLEEITGQKLTLGGLLAAIRKGDGLSQTEFADLLGMASNRYLSDVEHGRRLVSPKMAAKYAEKLQYSPRQFVRLCLQDMVNRDGIKVDVILKEAA